MSIKKTISYVYETQLVDIIDVIHTDVFPIKLFDYREELIGVYKNPHWDIPIMYNGYAVRKIELDTEDTALKVFLKDDEFS